jgi:hypothetical protein
MPAGTERQSGSHEPDPIEKEELKRYHVAYERAARRNRDMLQWGAAMTAVLGIAIGTGGIFALADSIATANKSHGIPDLALKAVFWGGLAIAALLLLQLINAFHLRSRAESQADDAMSRLIDLDPDRYPPKE